MAINLPDAIANYFTAQNRHDTEATLAAFADDAVVTDEGAEYDGRDRIRSWIEDTFPGSPIELDFFFTLKGGKIASLATG